MYKFSKKLTNNTEVITLIVLSIFAVITFVISANIENQRQELRSQAYPPQNVVLPGKKVSCPSCSSDYCIEILKDNTTTYPCYCEYNAQCKTNYCNFQFYCDNKPGTINPTPTPTPTLKPLAGCDSSCTDTSGCF